jgi:hypothetical protein
VPKPAAAAAKSETIDLVDDEPAPAAKEDASEALARKLQREEQEKASVFTAYG